MVTQKKGQPPIPCQIEIEIFFHFFFSELLEVLLQISLSDCWNVFFNLNLSRKCCLYQNKYAGLGACHVGR